MASTAHCSRQHVDCWCHTSVARQLQTLHFGTQTLQFHWGGRFNFKTTVTIQSSKSDAPPARPGVRQPSNALHLFGPGVAPPFCLCHRVGVGFPGVPNFYALTQGFLDGPNFYTFTLLHRFFLRALRARVSFTLIFSARLRACVCVCHKCVSKRRS